MRASSPASKPTTPLHTTTSIARTAPVVPHLRAVSRRTVTTTLPPRQPAFPGTVPVDAPPTRLRPAHDPIPALIPDDDEPLPTPHQLLVAAPTPVSPSPQTRPRPHPKMIGRLALQAFEVVEGSRSLAQLGNLVSFDLCQHLAELRVARQEQLQVYQDQRTVHARCGSVRTCTISDDTVEATVILHTNRKVHAVAIRLEWAHQRWRASDLAIL